MDRCIQVFNFYWNEIHFKQKLLLIVAIKMIEIIERILEILRFDFDQRLSYQAFFFQFSLQHFDELPLHQNRTHERVENQSRDENFFIFLGYNSFPAILYTKSWRFPKTLYERPRAGSGRKKGNLRNYSVTFVQTVCVENKLRISTTQFGSYSCTKYQPVEIWLQNDFYFSNLEFYTKHVFWKFTRSGKQKKKKKKQEFLTF